MGTLITFYSFKGGVGRTQSLANIAVGLANRGRHVVVVDMDLESPGLHTFFSPANRTGRWTDADLAERSGLLEHLYLCSTLPEDEPRVQELLVPCSHPNLNREKGGTIRLLPAGRLDASYPHRVSEFSWEQFYDEQQGAEYVELLRNQLFSAGADFVLLDSRTGMTDIASICTFELPDVVVILFALHQQGLDGAQRVAQAIERSRQGPGNDTRARHIFLVPSRVDEQGESKLRDEWIGRAKESLEACGTLLADPYERIPYLAEMAFGENVVVDPPQPNILSEAYRRLIDRLMQLPDEVPSEPSPLTLADVRAAQKRVHESAAQLRRKLESGVSPQIPLAELATWTHEVAGLCSTVQVRLDEALTALATFGKEFRPPGETLAPAPRSLQVQELTASLDAIVEQVEQRLAEKEKEIRTDLRRLAPDDEPLVEQELEKLRVFLQRGQLSEVSAQLPALEEQLKKTSLDGLLKANQLERPRLAASIPELAAQEAWIEARLRQLLEEGSIESAATSSLWNLLRLVVPSLSRPTSTHWTAYDNLCLLVGDEPERGQLFEQVGVPLWRTEWTATFAKRELASFAGSEARSQLQQMRSAPAFRRIVDVAAAGLASVGTSGTQDAWQWLWNLLRQRRKDPVLEEALLQMNHPELQRKLSAFWLLNSDDPVRERLMLAHLLEGLVKERQAAESFFALYALAQRDPQIVEDPVFAPLFPAFLLRLIDQGHAEGITQLLYDVRYQKRLMETRAGHALLALLAGQLLAPVQADCAPQLRSQLLRTAIPDQLATWLRRLEQDGPVRVGWLLEIRDALREMEALSAATRFGHVTWNAGARFKHDFEQLVAEQRRSLPGSERGLLPKLDPEQWAREMAQRHRQAGHHGDLPNSESMVLIRNAFDRLRALLERLDGLLGDERAALVRHLSTLSEWERTRAGARDWAAAASGEGTEAAQKIRSWLGEGEIAA